MNRILVRVNQVVYSMSPTGYKRLLRAAAYGLIFDPAKYGGKRLGVIQVDGTPSREQAALAYVNFKRV